MRGSPINNDPNTILNLGITIITQIVQKKINLDDQSAVAAISRFLENGLSIPCLPCTVMGSWSTHIYPACPVQ